MTASPVSNSSVTPIKIGFVLLSNSRNPIPSTRVAVLNMFPFLREAHFNPQIVFEPSDSTLTPDVSGLATRLSAEGFRIVLFQKVRGPSVEGLARELKAFGIKTGYIVCDLVDVGMAAVTDATMVVTEYLKSLYPPSLHSKIHVVHDGIERPQAVKTEHGSNRGSRLHPLQAVLVTSFDLDHLPVLRSPPAWLKVCIVGRYPPKLDIYRRLRQLRWKLDSKRSAEERLLYLKFLADPHIQRVAWDPSAVYDVLRQADIGIIPIAASPPHESGLPPPAWKVKSENRLTMKMSMGLPVVATPIPSYEAIIEHGRNGFLARSQQDWLEQLEALRDPACRRQMGEEARLSVLNRYSMREQARRLITVLQGLLSEDRVGSRISSK